jgi:hypothetical protein
MAPINFLGGSLGVCGTGGGTKGAGSTEGVRKAGQGTAWAGETGVCAGAPIRNRDTGPVLQLRSSVSVIIFCFTISPQVSHSGAHLGGKVPPELDVQLPELTVATLYTPHRGPNPNIHMEQGVPGTVWPKGCFVPHNRH